MPNLAETRGPFIAMLRNAASLRFVLPGLLLLALTLPAQAECSRDISPALSRRAVEFIDLAMQSAGDSRVAHELLGLQADLRCGDADAIATLKPFLDQPDTELLATVMLVDVGQRDAMELLGALERAALPLERKADLLEMAADWPSLRKADVSAAAIVRRTEWAFTSGDERLSRLAVELRAMHGDGAAIAGRADRLMACAELPDGGIGSDCLGMHELHTAPRSLIQARWGSATTAQRVWLARWAQRNEELQTFLLANLASEASNVQYAILTEVMQGGGLPVNAIKAALIVVEQAAIDIQRRPPAIPIDFSSDHRERMFGIAAYEAGENFPLALQVAFDELTTYPDARNVMRTLASLDHPWLATHAGMWLVRHGHAESAMHALRFSIEDDGLPAESVLARTIPGGDGISPELMELFLASLRTGRLGKWNVFATSPFQSRLEDPAVVEAILTRIAALPERTADAGIDVGLDQGFPARIQQQDRDRSFKHETDAFEWAAKALKGRPDLLDRYLQAFAANDAPFWRVIAMSMATELGRMEVARTFAPEFADSPLPPLRAAARKVLGVGE